MNRIEFAAHTQALFNECQEIIQKKNADYSASDENAFRNFEAVQTFNITDRRTGLLVRLTDKFTRIANLLKKDPSVVEESLQDTIADAINYLAILHSIIADDKDNLTKTSSVTKETHA